MTKIIDERNLNEFEETLQAGEVIVEPEQEEVSLKVWVTRSDDGLAAEIDIADIHSVCWDYITGGYRKVMPYSSLYGYVSYDLIAESGIGCSGRHSHYYNDAKVMIPVAQNRDKMHRRAYDLLKEEADLLHPKPITPIYAGRTYCCRRVIELLKEAPTGVLERKEFFDKLVEERYWATTVRNVLRRLAREEKIIRHRKGNQYSYSLNTKQ